MNFYDIIKKKLKCTKEQDSFIEKIYLNHMLFYFIFLLPPQLLLDVKTIKKSIRNMGKKISFEII